MDLLPLASFLQTNNFGQPGVSLFVEQMPADCVAGILLRPSTRGTKVDYELPGYYKGKFKLSVRGSDYPTCKAQIESIIAALTVTNTQIGTMFFKFMRPLTLPMSYPLSKSDLIEYAVDFEVCFVG